MKGAPVKKTPTAAAPLAASRAYAAARRWGTNPQIPDKIQPPWHSGSPGKKLKGTFMLSTTGFIRTLTP
jgi:hypothetical protein